MKKLFELHEKHNNGELTSVEAIKLVFDIYCISESTLAKHDLKLIYVDYGLWQLRQLNDQYLIEGDKAECLEYAKEIIDKYSR